MGTSNQDFKAIAAKRREGRLRPEGVPQTDPVVEAIQATQPQTPAPPARDDAGKPLVPPPSAPAVHGVAAVTVAPPVQPARSLTLTTVDTSEQLRTFGSHMYPTRHRQLIELAFMEDRKPWAVIEQALDEYVKRHYPSAGG